MAEKHLRIGYWLPVFGGWLRNVPDEGMAATWHYIRTLCERSEQLGYDLTLIAELNLNDIKGVQAPSMDAWSTAAALAAVTDAAGDDGRRAAHFHQPALLAKQAANIDHLSGGRVSLNVVSSWWAEEAKMLRRPLRPARRPLRAHVGMARRRRRLVEGADASSFEGRYYTVAEHGPRAQTAVAAAADAVCRRRIRGRQGTHRAEVRRLRHARRSSGPCRGEDRRHARPPRRSTGCRR